MNIMDIDIDTIVTVVFVAIIIVFNVFGTILSRLVKGKKTGANKKGRAAKADGILQTLKSRVTDEIQTAMEQVAVAQGKQGATARPAQTPVQPGRPLRSTEGVKKTAGSTPAISNREEAALIDQIRQEMLGDEDFQETRKAEMVESDPVPAAGGYAVTDLRRALIWSEILAPPLALRD